MAPKDVWQDLIHVYQSITFIHFIIAQYVLINGFQTQLTSYNSLYIAADDVAVKVTLQ